jgi:hypothetical protein
VQSKDVEDFVAMSVVVRPPTPQGSLALPRTLDLVQELTVQRVGLGRRLGWDDETIRIDVCDALQNVLRPATAWTVLPVEALEKPLDEWATDDWLASDGAYRSILELQGIDCFDPVFAETWIASARGVLEDVLGNAADR